RISVAWLRATRTRTGLRCPMVTDKGSAGVGSPVMADLLVVFAPAKALAALMTIDTTIPNRFCMLLILLFISRHGVPRHTARISSYPRWLRIRLLAARATPAQKASSWLARRRPGPDSSAGL